MFLGVLKELVSRMRLMLEDPLAEEEALHITDRLTLTLATAEVLPMECNAQIR
jgi:hypothetical protein